jgi:outer membrane murein-binding lipoprotein Lpp
MGEKNMKKFVAALALSSIILTGCGSTSGVSSSSAATVEQAIASCRLVREKCSVRSEYTAGNDEIPPVSGNIHKFEAQGFYLESASNADESALYVFVRK